MHVHIHILLYERITIYIYIYICVSSLASSSSLWANGLSVPQSEFVRIFGGLSSGNITYIIILLALSLLVLCCCYLLSLVLVLVVVVVVPLRIVSPHSRPLWACIIMVYTTSSRNLVQSCSKVNGRCYY